MTFASDLGADFAEVLKFGQQVRFRFFDRTHPGAGSFYDDDVTLAQSGADLFVSGIVQPIDQTEGSDDAVLLAQGKILRSDLKLYIAGSVQTSGTFKVGLGSPPGLEFSSVEKGTNKWTIGGEDIYKKLYLRHLTTGSLAEE